MAYIDVIILGIFTNVVFLSLCVKYAILTGNEN